MRMRTRGVDVSSPARRASTDISILVKFSALWASGSEPTGTDVGIE